MEMNDIQKFIGKNKDKVTPIKSLSGDIIGIRIKDKKGLDFSDTNCKLGKDGDKDIIVTNDNTKFEVSYPTKIEAAKAWMGRTFKQVKMRANNFHLRDIPGGVASLGVKIGKAIDSKVKPFTDKIMGVEPKPTPVPDPVKTTITPIADSISTKPVANYGTQKAKADDLTKKLDEILQKYEKNEKFANDPDIKAFRERFNEIKGRYDFATLRNDSAEMLNVKTKLVNLSGRIIAKQNSLDKAPASKAPAPKAPDSPKAPTPIPLGPVVPKAPDKPKTPRKPKPKQTKPKKVPKTTVSAAKATPKPKDTMKGYLTRFKNTYTKKMDTFDKSIGLFDSKIALCKSEISKLEESIKNIDTIAEENNFDSREKGIFIDIQKEKIDNLKKELEAAEAEKKKVEEEKNKYQNEMVSVKSPNQYAKEGYLQMKMKRSEFYREIASAEILEDNKEINELEAKLAKLKAERDAKVKNVDAMTNNAYSNRDNGASIDYIQDLVSDFHGEDYEFNDKPMVR